MQTFFEPTREHYVEEKRKRIHQLSEEMVAMSRIESVLRQHSARCEERCRHMTACDHDEFLYEESMAASRLADEAHSRIYRMHNALVEESLCEPGGSTAEPVSGGLGDFIPPAPVREG